MKFPFSLKNKKLKKVISYNPFYKFAIFTLLFEIFFSFFTYYITYNSYSTQLESQLTVGANRIENTLRDIFAEAHQIMMYIGKQISLYGEQDPHFIEKILENSHEFVSNVKNIYPWSLFDWVDPNNFRTVNTQIGLIKDGHTKVYDSYTWKCSDSPWTLQVSHPSIGNTSGMWAIPAGVGITDKNKKYLGTLNIGFNIAGLNAEIQQTLSTPIISFVVLDEDFRIVLQSADNSIDPKSSYYRDVLPDKNYFKDDKNCLSFPLSYKNIKYTFYKKIKGYPYVILVGFNKDIVQKELWALLLPRLLELYGVGIFCLFLLYILRKKLFTLNKDSGLAKKTYMQRINLEMKESVETILSYTNVLIKNLKDEAGVIVTKERKIEFMEKIYKAALNVYNLASDSLNFEYIAIRMLIEDSVSVLTEDALEKHITIKTFTDASLPPFYGDRLRLQQIIVGLISLSIEYSPKDSTVEISSTTTLSDEGRMLLMISIEDNGFNLDAEDMTRISKKLPHEEAGFSENHLDFPAIEKLIHFFRGTCHICNKSQRGKIIKITLPYSTDKEHKNLLISHGKNGSHALLH